MCVYKCMYACICVRACMYVRACVRAECQVIRQSFLICLNIRRPDAGPTSEHACIFRRQMFNFVSIILQQFHNFFLI